MAGDSGGGRMIVIETFAHAAARGAPPKFAYGRS
jgi:hypothetical protein